MLAGDGVTLDSNEHETLEVTGWIRARSPQIALDNRVLVYELTPLTPRWKRPTST